MTGMSDQPGERSHTPDKQTGTGRENTGEYWEMQFTTTAMAACVVLFVHYLSVI